MLKRDSNPVSLTRQVSPYYPAGNSNIFEYGKDKGVGVFELSETAVDVLDGSLLRHVPWRRLPGLSAGNRESDGCTPGRSWILPLTLRKSRAVQDMPMECFDTTTGGGWYPQALWAEWSVADDSKNGAWRLV